jgi:hypothetical protein
VRSIMLIVNDEGLRIQRLTLGIILVIGPSSSVPESIEIICSKRTPQSIPSWSMGAQSTIDFRYRMMK